MIRVLPWVFRVPVILHNHIYYYSRFLLKRLFQYQAASEAGVFQAPPYAPFPPDILPPVMLPPYAMDKVKAPKVKAKRVTAKPKTEKEPKSSVGTVAKAQRAASDTTGLSGAKLNTCTPLGKFLKTQGATLPLVASGYENCFNPLCTTSDKNEIIFSLHHH